MAKARSKFKTLVAGILIGVVVVVLGDVSSDWLRSSFLNPASLHAEVHKMPFLLPASHFEAISIISEDEVEERLEWWSFDDGTRLEEDQIFSLKNKIVEIFGLGAKDSATVREAIFRARGLVVATITNDGSVNLKDVRLTVPGAVVFAKLDEPVEFPNLNVNWSETLQIAQLGSDSIVLRELPQDSSVTVFVWTSGAPSGWGYLNRKEGLKLHHSNGDGTIHLYIPVTGLYAYLEHNTIETLMMIFFSIVILGVGALIWFAAREPTGSGGDKQPPATN